MTFVAALSLHCEDPLPTGDIHSELASLPT